MRQDVILSLFGALFVATVNQVGSIFLIDCPCDFIIPKEVWTFVIAFFVVFILLLFTLNKLR